MSAALSEELKHTPGPWNTQSCIVRDKTGQIRIAECDVSYQLHPSTMRANAHLIAAAPDLLAALKVYLNAGHKEARRAASVIAKAAIAKAEGRAE